MAPTASRIMEMAAPAIVVIILAVSFGVPLTCENYDLDSYGRFNGTEPSQGLKQIFCLPTGEQHRRRSFVVQLMIVLLGTAATLTCMSIAGDAFHKLSTHRDGVSTSLAEILLQLPSPTKGSNILSRVKGAIKHEPRSNLASKILLVFGILSMPLFVGVTSPLAAVAYREKLVRFTEVSVNVTGLPEWITTADITKYGWTPLTYVTALDWQFAAGKDIDRVASWSYNGPGKRTPSGYEGDSLYQFVAGDVNKERARGSGLQTVVVSVPKEAPPRTLGFIPLSNVLLTAGGKNMSKGDRVPYHVNDFTIEQSLLLVDQMCSAYSDSGKVFEGKLALELADGALDEVFSRDADIPKFAKAMSSPVRNVWVAKQVSGYSAYNLSSPSNPMHYHHEWELRSDGKVWSLMVYTASPRIEIGGDSASKQTFNASGLLCKTSILPITANVTIPPGFRAVRHIGKDYTRIPFSDATRSFVSLALNLSTTAVDMMHNNASYLASKDAPADMPWTQLSSVITPCHTIELNDLWSTDDPKALYYDQDSAWSTKPVWSYADDSCVATEFDRLLKVHLTYLSYIPSNSSTSKTWAWGRAQTRFVPNRTYCGVLLVLLLLTAMVLVALRWITWIPADSLGEVDMTAPWCASLAQLQLQNRGAVKQQAWIVKCDPRGGELTIVPAAGGVVGKDGADTL